LASPEIERGLLMKVTTYREMYRRLLGLRNLENASFENADLEGAVF